MNITVLFLGGCAVVAAAELAAHAFFLQLGSRWMKTAHIGFCRALWVIIVVGIVGCIPGILLDRVPTGGPGRAAVILLLQVVLSWGLAWLVVARMLKTSLWRGIIVWLVMLIPAIGFALLALFVVRPYMFEAFKIPTNSMAPTVLGKHWEAPCPRCGSPAFCTSEPERPGASHEPVLMICSRELRSCKVDNPPRAEHPGDRLVVTKFIHPQRWDVIVFRLPEDPEIYFCKRLVGLPGETVTIKDGAVWIDGKRQSPPDSCKSVEYIDHFDGWPSTFWGNEAHPAKLGPDEYFVLGDFSARAKDSRLWEKGAPGHPPYAVPASYIVGVVTHIYWPLSR